MAPTRSSSSSSQVCIYEHNQEIIKFEFIIGIQEKGGTIEIS